MYMKMKAEKWAAVVATIVIFVLPSLYVLLLNNGEEKVEINPNKSTIAIDTVKPIVYTKHTDKLSLAESSRTLETNQKATDQYDLIVAKKAEEKIKLRQEKMELEAKKVTEAKRIKEEKRIAAEKAKKAELAKIAEEKKKAAQAEATRIANTETKKKQEAKQKASQKSTQVAQSTPKKKEKAKAVSISRGSSSNFTEAYYEITAYTAGVESTGKSKGDKGYGLTASGAYVQNGLTLACPRSIAFGTKIEIEGYGVRVCQDRGGHITNGRLDIYISDLGAAQQFGRRTLKVKIYK